MAKNQIKIEVVVDDKGNLKSVGQKAQKASKNLDNTARSAQNADRALKGTAQASSNSTKNFAKISQGITGGLVPAYATLAANIFAVSAAFQFLKSIGDLRTLEQSQLSFSRNTGVSLGLLTSRVQDATEGLLKYRDAAEAVSIGRAAGLSSSQIEGLASVAKDASIALGRDLTDSFNRLTRGAIKAEPELLDELGIVVRLDRATTEYAQSIGKTAKELTTWERSQAVVNQVLKQGQENFKDLNVEVNGFVKLGRAFDDLLNSLKKTLSPLAEFLAEALVKNVIALAGAFTLLGANIAKSLAPAARDFTEFEAASGRLTQSLQETIDQTKGPESRTKTANRILSGEYTQADISRLKVSLRARNSSIFAADEALKEQAKRTLLAMDAQTQLHIAKSTSGFKRLYATWKAELYLLQAEHGKIMGTLTLVSQSTARFISTALNFLGWIGLAVTLFGIIRQIGEYFKSDEIKAMEARAEAAQNAFESQNEALEDLNKNLSESSSLMDKIAQASNLLSNFKFNNLRDLSQDLQALEAAPRAISQRRTLPSGVERRSGRVARVQVVETPSELTEAFQTAVKSANLYNESIAKTNINSQAVAAATLELNSAFEDFQDLNSVENRNRLTAATEAFIDAQEEMNSKIEDSNGAFQRLSGAAEAYTNITDRLQSRRTPLATLEEAITDAEGSLNTFKSNLESGIIIAGDNIESVFGDQIGYIETFLGQAFTETLEGLTAQEALERTINELRERRLKIAALDLKQATRQAQLDLVAFTNLQGITSLQRERVERENARRANLSQIELIQERLDLYARQRITLTDEEVANEELKLALLREQNKELNLQGQYGEQLRRTFNEAFTQGFQTGLSDIIKGKESSLKEAIGKLATTTLESIADTLSRQFTDMLFGKKDPATRFAEAGEYVAGLIYDATTGVKPQTGGFSGNMRNIGSGLLKTLGNVIFGKKIGTSTTAEAVNGATVAQGVGSIRAGGILNFLTNLLPFGNGGMIKGGFQAYASGGTVTKPTLGLVGEGKYNEAIVPLPDGKSIPVQMNSAGQENNIVINVSAEGAVSQQGGGNQGANLGKAIAMAVQKELQNQKRSGGILSPYGAA